MPYKEIHHFIKIYHQECIQSPQVNMIESVRSNRPTSRPPGRRTGGTRKERRHRTGEKRHLQLDLEGSGRRCLQQEMDGEDRQLFMVLKYQIISLLQWLCMRFLIPIASGNQNK